MELAEHNNAAKMIRVMCGEANELVADSHDPGGSAWTGRAAYGFVKASGIACGGCGLLRGLEEGLVRCSELSAVVLEGKPSEGYAGMESRPFESSRG